MSSRTRQRQFPSARPGTFIRASLSKLSRFRTLARRTLEVTPQILPLVIGQFLIPLSSRGIVMRTGIDDRVRDKVVRKIRVVWMAVEGELQNAGPRHLELVAQCLHVGRNQTQIFRNEP